MNRHILLFLITLCSFQAIIAQHSVSGTVIDNQSKDGLLFANIELRNLATDKRYLAVSGENSIFIIENLPSATYELKISYIGYNRYEKYVSIKDENVELGAIELEFSSEELTQIEVIALQSRVVQLGDTTQLNALAFKTNPDANAEDLIEKMPGFEIKQGELQAQGEKVQKVLVDGKPFFGDDPNMAMKNLPAAIIDKIQVFDDESEESKATGVSDGETEKTINIILKQEYKNGTFGKVYAGYGFTDKYNAGGNVNFFRGDRRFTLIAQSNNINIQNFSTADLLGVSTQASSRGPGRRGGRGGRGGGGTVSGSARDFLIPQQGGISTTHAVGMNYQDKWSEKTSAVGSYFANYSDNYSQSSEFEEFFNVGNPFTYDEFQIANSTNLNHRANLRIKYSLDRNNQFTIRPTLTWQQNVGIQNQSSYSTSADVLNNLLNQSLSTDLSAFSGSNQFTYSHSFDKRGRRISISSDQSFDSSEGSKNLQAEDIKNTDIPSVDQLSLLENSELSWRLRLRYTEPIIDNLTANIGYSLGNQSSEYDVFTNDFNSDASSYTSYNEALSNVFNNDYLSNEGEVGLRYRKDKLSADGSIKYQLASLDNRQVAPQMAIIEKNFRNLLGSASLRYKITDQKNVRLFYRSNTRLPNTSDLQDLVDNSNPLQIEIGNPNLEQQVDHRIGIRYSANDNVKERIFFAFFQSNIIGNYIGQDVTFLSSNDSIRSIPVSAGAQISKPINMQGYQNHRVYMTYGIPAKWIKSNLNFNVGTTYSRTPTSINSELFFTNTYNFTTGVVVASNISENIDFTFSTSSDIELARGNTNVNNTIYNITNSGKLSYIFLKHWKIGSTVAHNYYQFVNDGSDDAFILWNGSIARKFMKDNRAEISLDMFDILGSNTVIRQSYSANSYTRSESIALQRFLMVNFRYNIREFGSDMKPDEGRNFPR